LQNCVFNLLRAYFYYENRTSNFIGATLCINSGCRIHGVCLNGYPLTQSTFPPHTRTSSPRHAFACISVHLMHSRVRLPRSSHSNFINGRRRNQHNHEHAHIVIVRPAHAHVHLPRFSSLPHLFLMRHDQDIPFQSTLKL